MSQHGAETIKAWMQNLVEMARSGRDFTTSAGAEPNRTYAYLEVHASEEEHSLLLFRVEEEGLRTYRVEGSAKEVRERVDELTHGRA